MINTRPQKPQTMKILIHAFKKKKKRKRKLTGIKTVTQALHREFPPLVSKKFRAFRIWNTFGWVKNITSVVQLRLPF